MLFPTYDFAVFFLLVFAIAWQLRHNLPRKWFLVACSYFFYGYWDFRFMFLLLQCSLSNFVIGRMITKLDAKSMPAPTKKKQQKALMLGAVILNLAILAFFKYYGFFLTSFNDLLQGMGLARDIPIMEILLPVGISFFTFQGISYVVDVYQGKIDGNRPLVDVLLYVSFFPQLVAGPIVRADEFLPQLDRTPDRHRIPTGFAFSLIMIGLFKKSFIAHYLSQELVSPIFEDPGAFGAVDLLFGIYGYAMQIYCDFSAYSDIAIGIAALLGYQFSKNFDQPYRSASLQEFWRRWHISLSSWLRDYLYIPLGGNRKGPGKTYRNLFLTMLLGGLWHGAAWNFVLWGVLHGSYLAVEKFFRERFGVFARGATSQFWSVVWIFHFVCLTWIFFASPTFDLAIEYLTGFARLDQGPVQVSAFSLTLIAVAAIGQFLPPRWIDLTETRLAALPYATQGIVLGMVMVLLAAVTPEGVLPFIYFQF